MTAVSQAEVAKAQAQLHRMRASLHRWLTYRAINDEVAAGRRTTSKPQALAIQIAKTSRDWDVEQKLADHLHVLLSEVMPEAALPEANVRANPQAAVQLAQIAISGQAPSAVAAPQAQGASPPWLWPVLIVGGLLLAVTTAISSMADVAKSKEEYACIQAGACTDYGFWLKAAGVAVLGWFLWTKTPIGAHIRGALGTSHKKGG